MLQVRPVAIAAVAFICCGVVLAVALWRVAPSWYSYPYYCEKHLLEAHLFLRHHEMNYGVLPASRGNVAEGGPSVSWRVKLLPTLGLEDVYERYRFDEPWNSPANSATLSAVGSFPHFTCDPLNNTTQVTEIFAVTGNDTCWSNSNGWKLSEISRIAPHTIILIGARNRETIWMEPSDIDIDNIITRHAINNELAHTSRGLCVLFADGEVWELNSECPDNCIAMFARVGEAKYLDRESVLKQYRVIR